MSTLLKMSLDGEVVAEVSVEVYDGAKAWDLFCTTFQAFAPNVTGELFEAMRRACHHVEDDSPCIKVDIQSQARPTLVIPKSGLERV